MLYMVHGISYFVRDGSSGSKLSTKNTVVAVAAVVVVAIVVES